MPDQGDPIWGAEERFAEAVEPGRPAGAHADAPDPELARDLEIASMLRVLGPGFSASADAKARVRAHVMGALALDGPPSDGGGLAAGAPVPESAPEGAPTEQLPVVPPMPGTAEPTPAPTEVRLRAAAAGTEADTGTGDTTDADADRPVLRAVAGGDQDSPSTAVLAEPDLARAVRARRRRRHALPSRPAARPATPSVTRRVMAVGMAAMVAVLALAGGGVFASRDAVPGDPLYGIKRAAEAAGGIFAGGTSRGQHALDLAATRLDEIERMASDGVTDAAAYDSAFQDFTSATGAGSRMVLAGDDPDRSAADLSSWATQQTTRLSVLRTTLPAGAQPGADDALRLLDRVHRRAVALTARSGCSEVTSGTTDDLGPLAAQGPCAARQATSGGANSQAGSAPSNRARAATPTGQQAGSAANEPQQQQRSQPDDGSDPGLLPGVQVGPDGQSGDSAAPSSSAASSSGGKKNVNVPLPLPIPITVPPLVPGGKGGLLG
jgi:Domain of unknown function (DUF5667)